MLNRIRLCSFHSHLIQKICHYKSISKHNDKIQRIQKHEQYIFINQMQTLESSGMLANHNFKQKYDLYGDNLEFKKIQTLINNNLKQKKYSDIIKLAKQHKINNKKFKNQISYAMWKSKKDPQQLYPKNHIYNKSNNRNIFLLLPLLALTYIWYRKNYSNKNNQQTQTSKKFDGGSQMLLQALMPSGSIQQQRDIQTRFTDVLGIDQFKQQLTQLVDYLKNPKKYTDVGAKLPKGILLVGSPGTGKTLLARALAGESGCSFFYKTGAQFDEMYVGVGARRVRKLFQKARKKAPSIIFIDQIDSLAGKRNPTDQSHSRDTVNQILAEMDGFKQNQNVVVIGATNFEVALDPAIKRPGRFDKIIHIPLPDIRGRTQIFNYYLNKIKFDPNETGLQLARRTVGFSGADIKNMVNIAILNAVRNNRKVAIKQDFQYAFDRIKMGIGRKSMYMTQQDRKQVAYHEIGHALTSLLTQGAVPLHKVTILPRGKTLGFTAMIPDKDNLSYTKKSIIAIIDVCMGGRAAQQIFFSPDEITTGCSDDLQKATRSAYNYIKFLGMKQNLNLTSPSGEQNISDQYNYEIQKAVDNMLRESYNRVKRLLKANEKSVHELAKRLIQEETLSVDQIKQLLKI